MLNIAYCSDDGYCPYVGVSMVSCIENNINDFSQITFHIIEENISEENKNKLKQIVYSFEKCEIKFYPFISPVDIPKSSYPPIGYATIFLADLLNVEKVIYIDGDTLILNSFKKLMSLNLENHYAAGVLDPSPPIDRRRIGFLDNDNYYNAGFLLFNLKKIRDDEIQEKFIKEAIKPYKCHDQDIINVVLKNNILTVPIKYNFFGQFLELDYYYVIKICSLNNNYYSKIEVEDSKNNIVCTHFLNFFHDVPWKDNTNPMFNEFKIYFEKTPFSNEDVFLKSSFPTWKIFMHKILENIHPKIYIPFAKAYIKNLYK